MQYILTEGEYLELSEASSLVSKSKDVQIQELCTRVANSEPVNFWGNEEAEIWGCILNDSDDDNLTSAGYCDECPVQDLCPNEHKKWSK